jgi:hypothetical protein
MDAMFPSELRNHAIGLFPKGQRGIPQRLEPRFCTARNAKAEALVCLETTDEKSPAGRALPGGAGREEDVV